MTMTVEIYCTKCKADISATVDQHPDLCGYCRAKDLTETKPVTPDTVIAPTTYGVSQVYVLGTNQIDCDLDGLTDVEVLKAVAAVYPNGVNLRSGNQGPVWVNPKMILNLAQPDGFGLELTGLAHTACELLRYAADGAKADQLGNKLMDRRMLQFAKQAETQAYAGRVNQLHSVRFGAGCKVTGADRVDPGIIEMHPNGRVAKMFAKMFNVKLDELNGKTVLVMRSPFILGGVFAIVFNDKLSSNLVLMNRLDFRKVTKGDYDGDNAAFYPIPDFEMAERLDNEIQELVVDNDATLAIRGMAAHSAEAEMWGELVTKSTEQKLNQEFTHTLDEWVLKHIKMGEMANKYTPYSYRISEVCSLMAAMGTEGAAIAGLMGAVIEEDYYLGLSGGPDGLNEALEVWMKDKLNERENQLTLFGGLRKAVNPDILTTEVRLALCKGGAINRGNFDLWIPAEGLVHMAWLIGKGRTTSDEHAKGKLQAMVDMASHPEFPEELRDNVIVKMIFHAARKLHQVVGMKPADADLIPAEFSEEELEALNNMVFDGLEADDEDEEV